MPELPEVEAVCARLRRELARRRIASAGVCRERICAPQAASSVTRAVAGRRFLAVERRGKNILLRLDGVILAIHLRMTGDLYTISRTAPIPTTASAWFRLENGRTLVFDDPRGLGVLRSVSPARLDHLLGALGIEPLSGDFTLERFLALARPARGPVKPWLMDQRRIAGLGNIYAAEVLFEARIHPRRVPARLTRARLERLHGAIVSVLHGAVQSALQTYLRPGSFSEAESFEPAVYGREGLPCGRCGRNIRRIEQGGRSTYFCPGCQT